MNTRGAWHKPRDLVCDRFFVFRGDQCSTASNTLVVRRSWACFSLAMSCAAQQTPAPATSEGDFVVHNFQFRSGESLPELRLHYTTLGKPSKDAAGHTTNAVLILHGTGGTGHQFLQPQFAGVLFGPGQLARCGALLHYSSRWHRPRKVVQAQRWHARSLPAIRLRRHGRRALSARE